MATILLVLLGAVVALTLLYLALMFRLSLDDKDFWLKAMSGTLLTITFFVSIAALISGHFVSQEQSSRTAAAQLEAGRANAAAGEANERAALANREAARVEAEGKENVAKVEAEARKELARIEGEAGAKIEAARAEAGAKVETARAEAARQVGEVQKDVARQQERAAIAEKTLLELRQRTTDRHLTPEQRARLIELLSAVKGGFVWVFCVEGDAEGCGFATEFAQVMYEAKWNPEIGVGRAIWNRDQIGLWLEVRNTTAPPARAVALSRALLEVQLPLRIRSSDQLGADEVAITVGRHP